MSEAARHAAGAWKRSTVTRGQQRFLAAYHAWTRGAGGLGAVVAALPALLRDRRLIEVGHDRARPAQ
jgi:hypothetical protein